jgi:DNA-binding GntR family transcriptional regulator
MPRNSPTFETISARVQRQLHRDIVGGRIAPGTRLVRRTLAANFGVSLSTITEALSRLDYEGLVDHEPLLGSRVKPFSVETLRNEQVLREALECHAARLCADSASRLELEELSELADELDPIIAQADAEDQDGMELHLKFHLRVAEFARVPALTKEISRLWHRRLMFINWFSAAALPVPAHWHRKLVDAISSRNPAQASAAMREHVRYGSEHQRDAMRGNPTPFLSSAQTPASS